jgi:hypothetical protein
MATEAPTIVYSSTVSNANNNNNDNGNGVVNVLIEKEAENFSGASLGNDVEEVKDIVITEEDKEAMENGEDVNVWLEVKDNEDQTPKADIKVVEKALPEEYNIGLYLDVSLWKQVGSSEAVKITNVSGGNKVKVSMIVPEDLQKEGRTYQIIRVHEGVATILDTELNTEDFSLSFETDRFSTYALTYSDTQGESKDSDQKDEIKNQANTKGNTTSSGKGSGNGADTGSTFPKTGDTENLALWALLLIAALGGMLTLAARRKE